MTNDEMPAVIWVHWTLDYVSDVNEDGQCTKYHRAQEPIEGLREAVSDTVQSYLNCCIRGDFESWGEKETKIMANAIKALTQAAKRQLESEG